jgi:hypothetical protein
MLDAFVLPGLAGTILIALVWLSTKWLGKKEDRALYGIGDPEPDDQNSMDPYDR